MPGVMGLIVNYADKHYSTMYRRMQLNGIVSDVGQPSLAALFFK